MNKLFCILSFVFIPLLFVSQEVLWYDNFENYSGGYDVISNTSGLQGWGANGTGLTVLDIGNGANGSNVYYESSTGSSTFQYVLTPTVGVTYNFYASISRPLTSTMLSKCRLFL